MFLEAGNLLCNLFVVKCVDETWHQLRSLSFDLLRDDVQRFENDIQDLVVDGQTQVRGEQVKQILRQEELDLLKACILGGVAQRPDGLDLVLS